MSDKRKYKCEICGKRTCGSDDGEKRSFMAKFPLDEDRCKQWVAATGKKELIDVPIEKLHKLKYICGKHFRSKDFMKKKTKLRKNAVPHIDIAKKPLANDMFSSFPLHIAKICGHVDHNYCRNITSETISCTSRIKTLSPKPSNSISETFIETDSEIKKTHRPKPSTTASETFLENDLKRKRTHSPKTSALETCIESDLKRKRTHSPKPSNSTSETFFESDSKIKRTYSPTSSKKAVSFSPRKQKLMKKLKISRIQKKKLQKKVDQIENISSPVLKSLIESSIANQNRKPKGKRYTKLSKSVALAIYKKSPKTFRYFSTLLPMPSIRTLQTVLQNMKMEPGIDPLTLSHLEKKSKSLSDNDKLCVLLFDEVALKKRLIYNQATDKVDGFEDLGDEGGRTSKIADHALVLMIQGIHKKIKQPIGYYFVKGTISSEKLTIIIKSAIRAVNKAGFTVLGTVCDQGPTNVGALNLLKTLSGLPADLHYFLLDSEKIFTIFDVPHLFKSIRNNFYQGGEIVMDNKRGKWVHLVKLEGKNRTTLHFNKISKLHVEPKFRSKMRVKLAAQILSNTVAAILKLLSECVENKKEANEILQTAHLVEELDQLFDCTNGPASRKDIKKGIRQNVSKNSFHHQRWPEYKRKLKTLSFLKSDSQIRLRNVRCVNGFIITISCMQDIWKIVESKKIKYMNLRQLNQDALENLFGLIRQHCPTNKNPTCHHFTSALKSAVLSRLSAPISRGANCQQDENEIVFDFQDIVFQVQPKEKENNPKDDKIQVFDNNNIPTLHIPEEEHLENDLKEMENVFKKFEKQPTVYVAGYLAKLLLKDVNCPTCINAMKVNNPVTNSIYNYIALREWSHDKISLTYPTLNLCNTLDTATNIFEQKIKPNIYIKDINTFSKTEMLTDLDFSWMCEDHKNTMVDRMLQRLSLLLIRNHCKITNSSFALNEESSADSFKKAQLQSIAK